MYLKSTHTMTPQLSKPVHILEKIVCQKQQEVTLMSKQLPISDLKFQLKSAPPVRDFLHALKQNYPQPSIIAEVKKASPSKGVIRTDFDPVKIAQAYERGGASCISVLTDEKFFQGSFQNLQAIRNSGVKLPLLCKEFIIDPYQIYKARVNGADAILLIAAILSDERLAELLQISQDLGMTTLVEVHTSAEFDHVLALPNVQLVGINNRNLSDFSVNLETTKSLLALHRQKIRSLDITVVSESGIHTSGDLAFVIDAGAEAVLIGESLINQADVEQAVKQLTMRH